MLQLIKSSDNDIIQWLMANPEEQNDDIFIDLCQYGRIDAAKWLYSNVEMNLDKNNCECIRKSIENNQLSVISWLYFRHNWRILMPLDKNHDYENEYENILCFCCRYGYFTIIKLIHNIDIMLYHSIKSNKPFALCCQGGYIEIAMWLLVKEPNIDIWGKGQHFYLTCLFGHLKMAKWIHGLVMDTNINDWSDIIFDSFLGTCKNGHIKTAKWLLAIHPSIEFEINNNIIFRTVCSYGHLDMAKWIYELNPDTDISSPDLDGSECAFRNACCYGHFDMAKWLYKLKRHSDIDISTMEEYAFRKACQNGHIQLVKWLLEKKPDINISACDYDGYEAPFRTACHNGHLEIAKLLLEKKPDIHISIFGENAFRIACINGHLEVAQWLLRMKSDIDISVFNNAPFRYACRYGHLHILKWLLHIKPEINTNSMQRDDDAFRWACIKGYLHIVKWLLEVRPDINISLHNESVFRWTCKMGHLDTAKYLLEIKPDINISVADTWGVEAAFRNACWENKLAVAKWLLCKKPELDIHAVNDFAFNAACRENCIEIARWLRSIRPNQFFFVIRKCVIIEWKVMKTLIINENRIVEREKIRQCPICMDRQASIITNCEHQYCQPCFQILYNQHNNILEDIPCPYCRRKNLVVQNMV